MIPVPKNASCLFFLLKRYIKEGIIANSIVAYIDDVRADKTLYVQKQIKIIAEYR